MDKYCPKCCHSAPYDPFFKAFVCKYCGWLERVDTFDLDTQKISIDWSDGVDCTAATSMCGSCRTVFDTKIIDPNEDNISVKVCRWCPSCGIEFKKHVIIG